MRGVKFRVWGLGPADAASERRKRAPTGALPSRFARRKCRYRARAAAGCGRRGDFRGRPHPPSSGRTRVSTRFGKPARRERARNGSQSVRERISALATVFLDQRGFSKTAADMLGTPQRTPLHPANFWDSAHNYLYLRWPIRGNAWLPSVGSEIRARRGTVPRPTAQFGAAWVDESDAVRRPVRLHTLDKAWALDCRRER